MADVDYMEIDLSLTILYQNKILQDTIFELKKMKRISNEMLPIEINRLVFDIQIQINSLPDIRLVKKKAEKINKVFYQKLKSQFPELTKGEVELCTWFKLGLSNKEVATLKGINMLSVKKARQRLRKKLKLDFDQDIYLSLSAF